VYGEYVSEYVKNGANIIFIITNDGWWDDTPGYKQHLAYATLRAIETRKPIVRSANTGTSCYINEKGEIKEPTDWWKKAVIKATVKPNTYKTFYVNYKDLLSIFALIIASFSIIWWIILLFRKRK
jgi:apolipoprotein N-acyltransferase